MLHRMNRLRSVLRGAGRESLKTLKRFGGNKTDAAKALGITCKTLHARLNEYQRAQDDAEKGGATAFLPAIAGGYDAVRPARHVRSHGHPVGRVACCIVNSAWLSAA